MGIEYLLSLSIDFVIDSVEAEFYCKNKAKWSVAT